MVCGVSHDNVLEQPKGGSMSAPFLMPALSPTMTEGSIVQWHRQEGDRLRAGDPLLDIETDKAVAEVEAPFDGVLERILQPAGQGSVAVGVPIAIFSGGGSANADDVVPPAIMTSPVLELTPISAVAEPNARESRQFATPLARRLVREHGIQLAALEGSGPGGRVVKRDVLTAVAAQARPVAELPRSVPSAAGMTPFHLTINCQVDSLMKWLRELAAEGLHIELDDFILAACARAIMRVPQVNVTWGPEGPIQQKEVHLALLSYRGSPNFVMSKVHDKSLQALAQERLALIDAASERGMDQSRVEAATFSISSLGAFDIHDFTMPPVLPLACSLAVGGTVERPVARGGVLVTARVMTCSFSAFPEAVDAISGAEFLAEFRLLLEHPLRMVL